MKIVRPCYGIHAGIFSTKKKLAKKDKTYEYHKKITIISEEYAKAGENEWKKRHVKEITKDSKGGTKT